MEHCRPKRPGDSTGAGRVWTDQGLARNGGDKSTCVLVAGQTVGSGNKGIAEAERLATPGRREPEVKKMAHRRRLMWMALLDCITAINQTLMIPDEFFCSHANILRIRTTSAGFRTGNLLIYS
jgi:hypothetical protein